MTFLLIWLALAAVVGCAAKSRGHSGTAWFLLAVIISPVVGGLLVIALPRLHDLDHWILISPTLPLAPALAERAPEHSPIDTAGCSASAPGQAVDLPHQDEAFSYDGQSPTFECERTGS